MNVNSPFAVRHPPSRIVAWLVVLTFCGCGSGDSLPLAPVHGTVTYLGKPLDHGMVVFMPEPGTPGPPATGDILPDGSFRMKTLLKDGASIGRHRVLVHCTRSPGKAEERRLYVEVQSLIPEKYSRDEQSPLRFEVKAGRNEHPIVLE